MRKHLSSIGNSLGLVIEKPILDLLNIDKNTELDLRTNGKYLIIRPVRSKNTHRERVRNATTHVMNTHDSTLGNFPSEHNSCFFDP